MREFQYIAELPEGYEYKIIRVMGEIRFIGVAHDKPPVCFMLQESHRLVAIEINENGFK